ncbi:MAG TPA: hypothetical protein VGG28_15210 [Kofleriaceae bacterium]|jgi:hypothetical protein
MTKLVVLVLVAGCAVDEAPDQIATNTLATSPMQGPFESIELACASTPPCGGTEWGDFGMVNPQDADCSEIAAGPETGELRIAGVGCSTPNPLAMSRTDYQAYVQRADGWWRSDALVTVTEHHHCSGDMQVAWEAGGAFDVARIATTVDCDLSREVETVDYLVAIDPTGAAPIASDPVIVGEHVAIKDQDYGQLVSDPFDATLDVHWADASTLVLDGPTLWRRADVDNEGTLMSYFDDEVASPAGVWTVQR